MDSAPNPSTYLSDDETLQLFEQGRIRASPRTQPPYTKREGEELRLRAVSLRDPGVFITSLRDFVRANALRCWYHEAEEVTFSEEERRSNMRRSEATLRRQATTYGTVLTREAVRERLTGQAAEFVIARWIRTMLDRFSTDPEMDVSMPVWKGHEPRLALGGDYFLQPLPGTNHILYHEDANGRQSLREQDMMIHAGSEIAYHIDVSTSETAVDAKLDAEPVPEELFMLFRRRMREVFWESRKTKGYRNVAKLHFISSEKKTASTAVRGENGKPGIFKAHIPAYKAARRVSDALTTDLQDEGVMTLGSNGVFLLRR